MIGFSSAIRFVHPKLKNAKRAHRTVILPDYQGLGLGIYLRDFCGEYYHSQGFVYITTISHPALIHHMKRSPKWICTNVGRTGGANQHTGISDLNRTVSGINRITTSWRYIGDDKSSVKAV